MPRREETHVPNHDQEQTTYEGKHFIDEFMSRETYKNFEFKFCTFEKIGMKSANFEHCSFIHCEFHDCYMAYAHFEHCKFTGSFFERCKFPWATFSDSNLDYTNFMDCGPVLSQVKDQKPKTPQAAAKFCRNLASEHKKLGNWEEVDKFILESYSERERHFWYVVTGKNDHYKNRYNTIQRVQYFFRLLGHKMTGVIFGYGVSWLIFLRTLTIFGLIVFPFINLLLGDRVAKTASFEDMKVGDIYKYISDLYLTTIQSFMPFVPDPASHESTFDIPFWLSSVEAIFGTAMIAVFAALLFRWASKGA